MTKKGAMIGLITIMLLVISPQPAGAWFSEDSFIPCLSNIASESLVRTYQVRTGDTIWGIAKKAEVDPGTVLALNNLTEQSVIVDGQYINLPYSRNRLHRVTTGQTMWDVANRYRISLNQLIKANPQINNPDNLKIGQIINIPSNANEVLANEHPSRSITTLFSWPLLGNVSSGYGWRKGQFHHGIDIACPVGTPIKAAGSGKVIFAGFRNRIYGQTVIVQHHDGSKTLYAHTQKNLVKQGQTVKKGQVIARVGMSGRTTGPHLHFEVYHAGQTVNPLVVLKERK